MATARSWTSDKVAIDTKASGTISTGTLTIVDGTGAPISSPFAVKVGPYSLDPSSPVAEDALEREKSDIEWYTPPWIVQLVQATMGSITTDPCTTAKVNERIKADIFYTKETNGLDKPWYGNVWMNPPYARGVVDAFVDRLCNDWDAKILDRAMAITNSSTETTWYQKLLKRAAAVCLLNSRVAFEREEGVLKKPMQGQTIFYLGDDVEVFAKNFDPFGEILVRYAWLGV